MLSVDVPKVNCWTDKLILTYTPLTLLREIKLEYGNKLTTMSMAGVGAETNIGSNNKIRKPFSQPPDC